MAGGEELVNTEEEEAGAGTEAYMEEVLGVFKGYSPPVLRRRHR